MLVGKRSSDVWPVRFLLRKKTSPVELKIIAPPKLNFTSPSCLSVHNMARNILSCTPLQVYLGRAQARLVTSQGGLQGRNLSVMLVMDTPKVWGAGKVLGAREAALGAGVVFLAQRLKNVYTLLYTIFVFCSRRLFPQVKIPPENVPLSQCS